MLDELDLQQVAPEVVGELIRAERPLLIYGAGVQASADEARELARLLDIPICPTWGALALFPDSVGAFGTHGVRAANLAVQNADYILCIGSRLDTKATGSPASSFAPRAMLTMVDVDDAELGKMAKIGRPLYRAIQAEARDFFRHALPTAREYASLNGTNDAEGGYVGRWKREILDWLQLYPPGPGKPYEIMAELSRLLRPDDVLVSDTGCCLAWAMQALKFSGQRFIHAFNQTPMGYGLPAAIGAAFATGRRVVLLTGDGGLSVNIGELATLAHHALPVKVILFENRAHAMCEQTQRQWLDGRYAATSEPDLAFPDFEAVAHAYGLSIDTTLEALLKDDAPAFISLRIPPEQGVSPQIKFGEQLA